MTITLAKALKHLKRIKEQLAKLDSEIGLYNSRDVEADQVVDVQELYSRRPLLVKHIIQLKMAMEEASRPVRWQILLMAEIKGELTMLRQLDTTNGIQLQEYRETKTTKVASIKKADVDSSVKRLTALLDNTQEEVDRHNYLTEVVVEDLVI